MTEETNSKKESPRREKGRRLLRKTMSWLTIDWFEDEDEEKQ